MSTTLVRVDSPRVVQSIAAANHVSYTLTPHAASVTLADSVCYFWAA